MVFIISMILTKCNVSSCSSLELFNSYGNLSTFQFNILLIIIVSIIVALTALYIDLYKPKRPQLNILMLIIMLITLLMILSNSPVVIYITFELARIPIFIVIIGWGYQPEKIKAAYIILLYTIISAVPLIVVIVTKIYLSNSFRVPYHSVIIYNNTTVGALITLRILIGFIVKIPLYGVHL